MILIIKGPPVAQGRPRFARIGAGVRTYDPAKSSDWKKDIAWQAKEQGARIMEGPLSVEVIFYLPRPKSLPKKILHHIKKPDLDNLSKAVQDGLKGIAFRDDSQIVSLAARKVYAEHGGSPGVWINIVPALNSEVIFWLDYPGAPGE